MEFVKTTQQEQKALANVLKELFLLEGKAYSTKEVKEFIANETKSGRNFFLLKEGRDAVGCVNIHVDNGIADLKHFFVVKDNIDRGYGTKLLENVIDYCRKHNANRIFSVIPRMHELLFVQNGFSLDKNKVCVELINSMPEQQSNLQNQLKDISLVEEIGNRTAEKLRGLKTK